MQKQHDRLHKIATLDLFDAKDMVFIHNACIDYQPWASNAVDDFFTNQSWGAIYAFGVRKLEKLQGYIIVRDVTDYGEIIDFAVLPEYQKQGVGKSLLNYVVSNILVRPLLLEMKVGNLPAQKLYEEQGFQTVRTIKGYYKHNSASFDAVLMRLN